MQETKLYCLTATAEIDGAIRPPGYRFTLPEGVKGPHRTVGVKDVPLYVEVDPLPEPPAPETPAAESDTQPKQGFLKRILG